MTSKIEEMMERIKPNEWPGNELLIDPHKLAGVLCEMEERISRRIDIPPAFYDSIDPQEPNNLYKLGYLAALEEIEKGLSRADLKNNRLKFESGYYYHVETVLNLLDELKKKVG